MTHRFHMRLASPETTTKDFDDYSTSKYKSIINIINKDDFVPRLPLSKWEFKRYGQDKEYSVNDICKKEWEEMLGLDYARISNLDGLINSFASIIDSSNRNDCYMMASDKYKKIEKTDPHILMNNMTSEEIITNTKEFIKPYMEILNNDLSPNNNKTVVYYSPMFFMELIANISCSDENKISGLQFATMDVANKYEAVKWDFILSVTNGQIMDVNIYEGESFIKTDKAAHPHYLQSYYLLCKYLEGNI